MLLDCADKSLPFESLGSCVKFRDPAAVANPLALMFALAGCQGDALGSADSRAGRYTLRQIDGRALPGVVADGSIARVVIRKGVLRLKENGIFVDSTELQITTKLDNRTTLSTDVASGLYTVSDDTVYFRSVNRPGEHYYMVHATERSLLQELGGALLLYVR